VEIEVVSMAGKLLTTFLRDAARFAATLCLVMLAVTLLSAATTAARYRYIVDAAKTIGEIYYSPGGITDRDREVVAATACKALSTLADDKNFHEDLEGLLKRRSDSSIELRQNFQDFITKFLAIEQEAMLREGFDRRLVDATLSRVEFGRYANPREPVSTEQVVSQVRMLADATCKLEDAIKRHNKNTAVIDSAVRMTVQGFGGIIVIVVDVGETIGTDGFGALVGLLSEEIGRELVRNSAEELRRLISLLSG
jgi:hypothetical protein